VSEPAKTSAETRASCLEVEGRARAAIRKAMAELKEIIEPGGPGPANWGSRERSRAVMLRRAMWNGLVWTVLEVGLETFPDMVLDKAWLKTMVDRAGAAQKGRPPR